MKEIENERKGDARIRKGNKREKDRLTDIERERERERERES